jgi:prepilin-type N-terminal cleavage/methylation domain-containing protein
MKLKASRGFTLLEILLVVAAIAILAGIVIVAINPARQLGETRNAERRVDIRTIMSAIQQFQLKYGNLPTSIPEYDDVASCNLNKAADEICKTDSTACSDKIDLSALTNNSLFLTAIPIDPQGSQIDADHGTGYGVIVVRSTGRVAVCAFQAELDETIVIQQ